MKYKKLTDKQILISIDRLTRFKYTEEKYLRVFKDIILSSLIEPVFKKRELDEMDYSELKNIAEIIFNGSLEDTHDLQINERLKDYECSVFNLSDETKKLLDNKLNYKAALRLATSDKPINLRWLKKLGEKDITNIREQFSTRFPISKVILAEGITEEILLPKLAWLLGYDFDKAGIWVLGAGGKNQVVKTYYKLVEELKIPIFVLLDNDAKENLEQIRPKLRLQDKIHLISSGEFEDLLPQKLILKTINSEFQNLVTITEDDFSPQLSAVGNLIEIFRLKGLHEFKKADFAQNIAENLFDDSDISDEIKIIFEELFNQQSPVQALNQ